MYKGVGVLYGDFVSLRPNYFIFIGYLKKRGGEGVSLESPEPPLDPPLRCVPVKGRGSTCTSLLSHIDQLE